MSRFIQTKQFIFEWIFSHIMFVVLVSWYRSVNWEGSKVFFIKNEFE